MGSKKHYGYEPCIACGKSISQNGGAYTSHFKKHIRAGEMEKLPTGGYRVIKAAEHSFAPDTGDWWDCDCGVANHPNWASCQFCKHPRAGKN